MEQEPEKADASNESKGMITFRKRLDEVNNLTKKELAALDFKSKKVVTSTFLKKI